MGMHASRVALCALAGAVGFAAGAVTIEDGMLSRPSERFPDGIILSWSATTDFSQQFTVSNGYIEENIKYFWMEVVMDTANGFPQEAGVDFDEAEWPTITGMTQDVQHTTTPTRAAVFSDFAESDWRWYYEVRIDPQPESEMIRFPDGWWSAWGSHISEINVETVCIPAPAGAALLALGATAVRRRRN